MGEMNNEPNMFKAVKDYFKSLPPIYISVIKWTLVVLLIIAIGVCVYTGINAHKPNEADVIATIETTRATEAIEQTEDTTPVETFVEFKETVAETIVETTAETTEVTEATEPVEVIEETEYVEPETMPEETYVEDIPEVTEAPEEEEEEEDNSEYYMSETEMLACVIYQEAGGEAHCDDCRRRVADVVLNRVASDSFPDSIYEVLTQYAQYGRFHWTGIVWPDRAYDEYEADAVARAWRIAEEVMAGQHSEVYGNGYIWQAEFVQGTDGFWCCGHFFGR